jgi:hypothetical protein
MGKLRVEVCDQQLEDDQLREGLLAFVSNDEGLRIVKAMGELMRSRDLGFWLNPRLMQELKVFAAEQQRNSSQGTREIDDTVFASWLLRTGSMEINLRWEGDQLREGLLAFVSNNDGIRLTKAVGQLMKSGDLAFWLSARLMRRVRAFTAEQQGESSLSVGKKVDGIVFVSWLLQVGSMEPSLRWEVESLPNNGAIYRMLMEGGQDEEGIHNNPCE